MVAGSEVTAPGHLLARLAPGPSGLSALRPTWSVPAAMRALRATLVVPALLALTDKVIGDPQMALFAVFGAFASLVFVTFGGTRRDKLIAHLELAAVGSIVLTIGTAVSGTAWLAAIVTIPVAFGLFFAGVTGPHAASGTTAALLAYVLPVASQGGAATIPSRLEGWWLAAAVSTAAVLLLSPRTPGDRLRASAAASATALADHLAAAVRDEATPAHLEASLAAKHQLMTVFAAAPFRPTGLATADQAMASVVQLLEWCTVLISDAMEGHLDLSPAAPADRELLGMTAGVLRDVAALLAGRDADPDLEGLERARAASMDHLRTLSGDPDSVRACAAHAFHAQVIALAARTIAADTLIATRRASQEIIAAERRGWYGEPAGDRAARRGASAGLRFGGRTFGALAGGRRLGALAGRRLGGRRLGVLAGGRRLGALAGRRLGGLRLGAWAGRSRLSAWAGGRRLSAWAGGRRLSAWAGGRRLSAWAGGPRLSAVAGAAGIVTRHASFRSVWMRNSLRGAIGLAAAVAVADLTGVQHGFWVVLGALSVLRTNAASTGATALRALAGTVLGFAVGAALVLGIGTGQTALWIALPVAVLVASYAPGTAPFTVGQAAFTVTVVVLFNLLAPAGWKVGLLRIEDVAIGCAVSLVVGLLFWPRGAADVVGDDLADAYRDGGAYLTQAVDWALGLRGQTPDTAVAAATASLRLDDALRGYLAEQGSKRLPKEELWRLVMASMRLRMTAYSLAGLRGRGAATYPDAPEHVDPERAGLRDLATELAGFYQRIAVQVGRPVHGEQPPAEVPVVGGPALSGAALDNPGSMPAHHHPHTLWVREHLYHLRQSLPAVTEPALHVAKERRTPWWR